jgi:hypothetical protein
MVGLDILAVGATSQAGHALASCTSLLGLGSVSLKVYMGVSVISCIMIYMSIQYTSCVRVIVACYCNAWVGLHWCASPFLGAASAGFLCY